MSINEHELDCPCVECEHIAMHNEQRKYNQTLRFHIIDNDCVWCKSNTQHLVTQQSKGDKYQTITVKCLVCP